MRVIKLLPVAVLVIVLLPGSLAEARPSSNDATATAKKQAAKPKAKRKSCKKGYALKTVKVKRKGKTARVKRCRKKKPAKRRAATPQAPSAPAPIPPPAPGTPRPLFDPPGKTLEGEAARSYIERYLHDSRFTDCPAGWPSCESEQRYSFSLADPAQLYDFDLYRCQLSSSPDAVADRLHLGFFYETGIVRPDGSWSFNGTVAIGARPSFYDWTVATSGTVTGLYKAMGSPPEPIAPLQYVSGARDCG